MREFVTSSSIVGFRYKDGIVVASDTSLNYGSLKMIRDVKKYHFLSNGTLMIAKGEYSDFQELIKICEEEKNEDKKMGVREWIRFIQRVMYYSRTNFNLLNLSIIVAGYDKKIMRKEVKINSLEEFDSKLVFGVIDRIGNFYSDDVLGEGISAFISVPYIREHNITSMNKEQAIQLMKECMQTLYYRDCMADNHVKIVGIDKSGMWEDEPFILNGNWEIGRNIE